jgi:hypothetical protein
MPHPAFTLGVIAVLVCAAAPLPVSSPARPPAQIGTLVGLSAEDLVARLGPPDGIAARSDELQIWVWGAGAGRREVFVIDGSVVRAAPDAARDSAHRGPLAQLKTPYLGQRVSDLIAELGQPDDVRAEPIHARPGHHGLGHPSGRGPAVGHSTLLRYGERVLHIDAGRVIRIGVDQPETVNGPH